MLLITTVKVGCKCGWQGDSSVLPENLIDEAALCPKCEAVIFIPQEEVLDGFKRIFKQIEVAITNLEKYKQ